MITVSVKLPTFRSGGLSRREKQTLQAAQTTIHLPAGTRRKATASGLHRALGLQTAPWVGDHPGDAPAVHRAHHGTHDYCQVAGSVYPLHRDWRQRGGFGRNNVRAYRVSGFNLEHWRGLLIVIKFFTEVLLCILVFRAHDLIIDVATGGRSSKCVFTRYL